MSSIFFLVFFAPLLSVTKIAMAFLGVGTAAAMSAWLIRMMLVALI